MAGQKVQRMPLFHQGLDIHIQECEKRNSRDNFAQYQATLPEESR